MCDLKGRKNKLIVYQNLYQDPIFSKLSSLYENDCDTLGNRLSVLYECAGLLVKWAETHGFCGNLPHLYLVWLLVMDLNVFTLLAENYKKPGSSLERLVIQDITVILAISWHPWGEEICLRGESPLKMLKDYTPSSLEDPYYWRKIKSIEKLAKLASKGILPETVYQALTTFLGNYGAGECSLYAAFRWLDEDGLVPLLHTEKISLSDLVGYELQKKELVNNTEAFLVGRPANNVLLYGDSGTGKTSSIKALLQDYYSEGLRMVEINRQQLFCIPAIVATLRDRKHKFILFLDDLSFEDFETEYKQLKMIIDGGLESKSKNVLVYATSNRRHLINETWKDREHKYGDVHHKDTLHEKLSLSDRFGISICYYSASKDEFLKMVSVLADKLSFHIPEEELFQEALRWEMRHPGFSGRNAHQFMAFMRSSLR